MEKAKQLILFGFFVLVLAGWTTEMPKNYQGPVAERPTYTQGDYWVEQKVGGKPGKWVFIMQEGNHFIFQSAKLKNTVVMDLDLGILKKVDGKSGQVTYQTNSPRECLKFPLWVGKKWYYTFEVRSQNFGTMVPIDSVGKVEKYEKITVRAGTFEAFKVTQFWQARGYTDNGINTFWYAPVAKRIIKEEGDVTEELIEYKVQ